MAAMAALFAAQTISAPAFAAAVVFFMNCKRMEYDWPAFSGMAPGPAYQKVHTRAHAKQLTVNNHAGASSSRQCSQ